MKIINVSEDEGWEGSHVFQSLEMGLKKKKTNHSFETSLLSNFNYLDLNSINKLLHKVSAWNAGNQCSIPGLGRFPGEGNGNSL